MQNEIAQVPEENKDELLCNPSRKKIFYTTKNLDETGKFDYRKC